MLHTRSPAESTLLAVEEIIPLTCRKLYTLAQRDPRRAVPLAHRALETLRCSEPLIQAWARYTLGWALLCWERFDEARLHLQDAHWIFEAGGARYATLRCRHALLLADLMQLARPDLEHDFAALAEEFADAEQPCEAVSVRIDQARLLYALGRPNDAAALLGQVEPIVAQAEPFDRARFLRIRGAVANLQCDGTRALDFLLQAERAFIALHNDCEVAKCWIERGWVALQQEHLDLALADYEGADRLFTRFDLPLQRAFCAKNIGLLMTRRGAYDVALQSTLMALAAFSALNRLSDIGACHLHIGNIYFYTSRWEAALASYIRAETIYAHLGLVGYSLVAKRNQVMIYHAQKHYAEAQTLLVTVERLAHELGNRSELAEVWRQKAELLGDTGQVDEAIVYYRQARDLFEQVEDTLGIADCAMEEGWLALKHEAVDKARSLFQSIAPLVVQHPYNMWRVEYGLARCAESANDITTALSHYRAASAAVAELRRRLASEDISSNLYTQAAQLHQDALRFATEQAAAEVVLEMAEGQRALVLKRLLSSQSNYLPEQYHAEHETLRTTISIILDEEAVADNLRAARLDTALAAYGDLLLRARHSELSQLAPLDDLEPAFDLVALRVRIADMYGTEWTAVSYILNGERLLICTITPDAVALEQVSYDAELQHLVAQATHPSYRRYTY